MKQMIFFAIFDRRFLGSLMKPIARLTRYPNKN